MRKEADEEKVGTNRQPEDFRSHLVDEKDDAEAFLGVQHGGQ